MTTQLWVQLLVYGISFGSFAGYVKAKLASLEKKQDKHNKLIDRMYKAENRLDMIEHDMEEAEKEKK
jgi:hypothetical protein